MNSSKLVNDSLTSKLLFKNVLLTTVNTIKYRREWCEVCQTFQFTLPDK